VATDSSNHPLGSLQGYLATGCDPVTAEINAQIAARHPFNTASYVRSFGRLPNYAEPRGYTEKIQWRKMFDRNPLFVVWCDKLQAREYARTRASDLRFAELLWVGDDPAAMPIEDIGPPFVIKPNNRSAKIVMVRGWEDLHPTAIREECRAWLSLAPYGARFHEWPYSVPPTRLMIERFIGSDREPPPDYRFDVFAGRTRQIFYRNVARDRRGMYAADWRPLGLDRWFWGRLDRFVEDEPPPKNLDRMVAIAEALADDADYVRVDLYNCDGEVFYGELTPYPMSGFAYWIRRGTDCNPHPPRGPDDDLGEYWKLSDIPRLTRMRNALIE
jgi:hypothetical protein